MVCVAGGWGLLGCGDAACLPGCGAAVSGVWQTVPAKPLVEAKTDAPPHDPLRREALLLSPVPAPVCSERLVEITHRSHAWLAPTHLGSS